MREAGTAYFDVMRIPILAGRPFDARDNGAAPLRVLVSKLLAERWFPGEEPIGHQIRLGTGPPAPTAEIVGVVGDVKHRSLDAEGFWVGQGASIVGAGLAVGGVLSIWVTRALSAFVFGIRPFDPLSVGLASAVLITVGAVAVLPAAGRAARTDPVSVLRSE